MDDSAESITERVRTLRKRAGFSLDALAKRLGYKGPSSLQRYESASEYAGGYLRRDLVMKLAIVLAGEGSPPISAAEVWELAGPEFAGMEPMLSKAIADDRRMDLPPSNARMGDRLKGSTKTIPLYGQAVGGLDGEFVLNGNHLDDITAPPSLHHVSGAYAVTVSGDSMEPRYFDSEVVFIDPNIRPRRGAFVVAQVRNPRDDGSPLAYVKRFVRWNEASGLILEQYNPPKELTFSHEDVVSVHTIVMGGTSPG